MQMICIGKLELTVDILKLYGGHSALYCGAGADVHKHGGLYIAVHGMEDTSAGATLRLNKIKHNSVFLSFARQYRFLESFSFLLQVFGVQLRLNW